MISPIQFEQSRPQTHDRNTCSVPINGCLLLSRCAPPAVSAGRQPREHGANSNSCSVLVCLSLKSHDSPYVVPGGTGGTSDPRGCPIDGNHYGLCLGNSGSVGCFDGGLVDRGSGR